MLPSVTLIVYLVALLPLSGVIGVNMYQFLSNNKQGRED